MSLWQITVIAFLGAIAALLGAVVVYARVLTNRIGNTNATLRRLEVALLTSGLAKEKMSSAPFVAAEARQSPVSAVPERGVPVAVDDGIPSYLTVRELKAISRQGRPSGDNAIAMYAVSLEAFNTNSVPHDESREALTAGGELARSDAPAATGELPPDAELAPSAEAPPNAVAVPSTVHAEPEANAELVPSAAAALEADQTLSAVQGSPSNSATSVPASDALGADARAADPEREERRKRDALLIMNAQRRRRRARGY